MKTFNSMTDYENECARLERDAKKWNKKAAYTSEIINKLACKNFAKAAMDELRNLRLARFNIEDSINEMSK